MCNHITNLVLQHEMLTVPPPKKKTSMLKFMQGGVSILGCTPYFLQRQGAWLCQVGPRLSLLNISFVPPPPHWEFLDLSLCLIISYSNNLE